MIGYQRGCHPEFVFTYRGKQITRMTNSGWNNAKMRAGILDAREHDLKHTFGSRLRAADVTFEDRQDLLGHKSGRITTDYSAANLKKLIKSSNKVCGKKSRKKTEFLKKALKKANPVKFT